MPCGATWQPRQRCSGSLLFLGSTMTVQAIINKLVSDSYFSSIVRTRTTERLGSWYEGLTPEALVSALLGAEWEAYPHASIKAPAQGFRAQIPGKLGIVELSKLPANARVTLLDPKGGEAFWDGKQKVDAVVSAFAYGLEAPDTDHTTMILGPESQEPGSPLTVWTFHPGSPVAPSAVDRIAPDGTDRHGQLVTVAVAVALGAVHAKLTLLSH